MGTYWSNAGGQRTGEDFKIPTALVHIPWAGWSEPQSLQTGGWETCGGDNISFQYFIMSYNRGSFFLTCSLNGITFFSFQSMGISSPLGGPLVYCREWSSYNVCKIPSALWGESHQATQIYEYWADTTVSLQFWWQVDKWHSPSHSPSNLRPGSPKKQFINYGNIYTI